MTVTVHRALDINVHPFESGPAVAVIAEHDLGDTAFAALIEHLGFRACVVDIAGPEMDRPNCKAVLVRSLRRLAAVTEDRAFADSSIIAIGLRTECAEVTELPNSPFAAGALQQELASILHPAAGVCSRVHLSRREREVVVTYVLGSTVRSTAAAHFISESTVRSHFRRVMRRYADAGRPTSNKTQLLIELIADGWVARERLAQR